MDRNGLQQTDFSQYSKSSFSTVRAMKPIVSYSIIFVNLFNINYLKSCANFIQIVGCVLLMIVGIQTQIVSYRSPKMAHPIAIISNSNYTESELHLAQSGNTFRVLSNDISEVATPVRKSSDVAEAKATPIAALITARTSARPAVAAPVPTLGHVLNTFPSTKKN